MSDGPSNRTRSPERDQRALAYAELVSAEADRLDDTLTAIRADTEAGNLTAREAADNRVAVLEAHLNRLRLLRAEYFGE